MLGTPWVRLDDSWFLRSNGSRHGGDVGGGDFVGRAVLHRGDDQRDDALGDRGIAVGEEMQPPGFGLGRIDPDTGRTAAHQRRVGLERGRHRIQLAAEFDEQAVALVAIEKEVFFADVVEAAHGEHIAMQFHKSTPARRWGSHDQRLSGGHAS